MFKLFLLGSDTGGEWVGWDGGEAEGRHEGGKTKRDMVGDRRLARMFLTSKNL